MTDPRTPESQKKAGPRSTGFGIGSALYKPGKTAAAVREDALRFVAAFAGASRA